MSLLRCTAGLGLRLALILSLAGCTTVYVAGGDEVRVHQVFGIAAITINAGPEQVLVVRRETVGLSAQQGHLLVGYEKADQVFAGRNLDCLLIVFPDRNGDPALLAMEQERIRNACNKSKSSSSL